MHRDNFKVSSSFDSNSVCNSGSGTKVFSLSLHLSLSSRPDPDVLADIRKWRKSLAKYSSQYVGQTLVYLNGTFEECRFRECNLGNLICDAMVRVTLSVGLRVSYYVQFSDLIQYITLPCGTNYLGNCW